ncbi:MAG: von Willebrand factor type A domain-containing protein [Planctomycetota bacterium]
MAENNEQHDPQEELRDRLIDGALEELVGGVAPPDLSERVLEAAGEAGQNTGAERVSFTEPEGKKMASVTTGSRSWGRPLAAFAVAACLLVAVGVMSVQQAGDGVENREVAGGKPLVEEPQSGDSRTSRLGNPLGSVAVEAEQFAQEADGGLRMMVEPRIVTKSELGDGLAVVEGSEAAPVAGKRLDFSASGPVEESLVRKQAEQGLAGREKTSAGVRFRVDESPGQELTRYLAESSQEPAAASVAVLDAVPASPPLPASSAAPSFGAPLNQRKFDDSRVAGRTAMGRRMQPARGGAITSFEGRDGTGFSFGFQGVGGGGLGGEFGVGPGNSGDQYARIHDNPFKAITLGSPDNRLSTFSIDVDTAAYANVRQFLMQGHTLPPADAVRIEEMINYFDYEYSGPTGDVPFAANMEVASCPWQPKHRLVRIGLKGREPLETRQQKRKNLVFLVDVSGSMNQQNKLPLLVDGMKMLARQLHDEDQVAIVVYAGSEGLALESTPGSQRQKILDTLGNLRAGGSTAGGAGITLAYKVAKDHFIEGGVNRVILATDGDFNVGTTSTAELERLAETKARQTGVFLTVLGFGRGNLNDAMMEAISGKGNGNYHYIDGLTEARKVLVHELEATLVTIAKDVKIQVEFNPQHVAGYRLIGYENRVLAAEDFNDDKKDAGEIGAGHTVTALYEIVPVGVEVNAAGVDPLKYGATKKPAPEASAEIEPSPEMLTLKIRYKQPDGDTSTKLEFPLTDGEAEFKDASVDFKFASAVAGFGMLLRGSEHAGDATLDSVLQIAEEGMNRDEHGYRTELMQLIKRAKELSGE